MAISILKEYNIDIQNINAIDSLMEEAKRTQTDYDYISSLKNPLKVLAAVIIPIITFVAQSIGNTATQAQLITLAIQTIIAILLIFSLVLLVFPTIKDIAYLDYNKYNSFISDMRQLKLFYMESKSETSE